MNLIDEIIDGLPTRIRIEKTQTQENPFINPFY